MFLCRDSVLSPESPGKQEKVRRKQRTDEGKEGQGCKWRIQLDDVIVLAASRSCSFEGFPAPQK